MGAVSQYELTWITRDLAVGHAPMSYADLEAIKAQGIDAIINLCAEFSDLHEIEEKKGFEVYYLPILDESAPDMEEMERALAWLDEAIYLGKKILVHCRFGIGRTGTFVTSYLLRKGLGLKVASRKLKHTRSAPSTYSQWRLLREYGKKSGVLKIREPSLENRHVVDLSTYFAEYEALVEKIDEDVRRASKTLGHIPSCGLETDECCFGYFDLELLEVIYLSNRMNRILKSDVRMEIIHRAIELSKKIKEIDGGLRSKRTGSGESRSAFLEAYDRERLLCPLNKESRCSLYEYRPLRCRLHGVPSDFTDPGLMDKTLSEISRHVFFAFSGSFADEKALRFSLVDTVSGRFVQSYFLYLASLAANSIH